MSESEALREPIQDVAHLGHVELLTPKPDRSLWYFVDILGMEKVHEEGRSAYLRGYGDYATWTLKLTEAKAPGVGRIGWRATSPQALERRAAAIGAAGLGRGWTNGDHACGRTFAFDDPDGHKMEIYYDETAFEAPDALRSTLNNLPMKYPLRGVGVRKTDHLALLCKDVEKNRAFAQDVLGLRLREQVIYENGIFIESGPSKHNNSQAFYIYSYEPGGNRVEIYTSGFFVFAPDFKVVVWDEAARGTGVYWGQPLPESFLHYATPDVASETVDTRTAEMVFDPR